MQKTAKRLLKGGISPFTLLLMTGMTVAFLVAIPTARGEAQRKNCDAQCQPNKMTQIQKCIDQHGPNDPKCLKIEDALNIPH